MPRKKRLSYDDKRKSVIAKLIFVTVVLAIVLLANLLMSLRPSKKPDTADPEPQKSSSENSPKNERIINEAKLKDSASKTLGAFKEQALNTKDNLEGVSEEAIETGRNKAEKTITDFVYESTLKPLIDKIQDLPEEQQELIKDAVCR